LLFEKKWEMGGGGGEGDLEMVVKEEMVVVAKGKLLRSRLASGKEKREAQGARCQERRNAAPPSARKEPPAVSNPSGPVAITPTSGTGPRT
jgi:hypothetical protein